MAIRRGHRCHSLCACWDVVPSRERHAVDQSQHSNRNAGFERRDDEPPARGRWRNHPVHFQEPGRVPNRLTSGAVLGGDVVVGVEFRLGHQDHKKVEDFLSRSPAGVSSVVLDTKAAHHQSGAAEAARDAGVGVIFDPQTDRLCEPGFDLPGLAYYRPGRSTTSTASLSTLHRVTGLSTR